MLNFFYLCLQSGEAELNASLGIGLQSGEVDLNASLGINVLIEYLKHNS